MKLSELQKKGSSYSKVQATQKKKERNSATSCVQLHQAQCQGDPQAICPVSQHPRVCSYKQSHGEAVVNSIHLMNQCTVKFFR